jgi:regulator of protease activity HflC (stomatin/prohibitin superfamily)
MTVLSRDVAAKVLEVVDHGLTSGLGIAEPGKFCVEAAVCYALGLPHSDKPTCVSPVLRSLKIALNDKAWSSPQARAKGLRRLAVAQLGSAGALDEKAFLAQVVDMTIRKIVPRAMRVAAKMQRTDRHRGAMEAAALKCEQEGTQESALEANKVGRAAAAYAAAAAAAAYAAAAAAAAYATAYAYAYAAADAAAAYAAYAAAYAAAHDRELAFFAEEVVQILILMKAPGTEWLDLTEAA